MTPDYNDIFLKGDIIMDSFTLSFDPLQPIIDIGLNPECKEILPDYCEIIGNRVHNIIKHTNVLIAIFKAIENLDCLKGSEITTNHNEIEEIHKIFVSIKNEEIDELIDISWGINTRNIRLHHELKQDNGESIEESFYVRISDYDISCYLFADKIDPDSIFGKIYSAIKELYPGNKHK